MPRHSGHHRVIVVPGFFGNDWSTRPLRRVIAAAGFEAHGWGMGFNWGARPDSLDKVEALVERVADGDKVTLIGWSVGGVFTREVAKRRPELVERVITLGSPVTGDPRRNNFWRVYERISGYPIDKPPVPVRTEEKPLVPTIALWSPNDGIVAAQCARCGPGESDETIEVACTHIGFMTCRQTAGVVVELLRRGEEPPPTPPARAGGE